MDKIMPIPYLLTSCSDLILIQSKTCILKTIRGKQQDNEQSYYLNRQQIDKNTMIFMQENKFKLCAQCRPFLFGPQYVITYWHIQ